MKPKILLHYFRNNWQIWSVATISILFFVLTSFFISLNIDGAYVKWGSPDETSNYVFAKLYGQAGQMSVFEKYNLIAEDIIRPRSVRSDYGNLKPVSFLGIILIYGSIVKYIGYEILPYLTPFFAALGIFYYYLLIKRLFGKRNALISVFLFASFPVLAYYTIRSMFHNVLFIVLTLIGLYYSSFLAISVKEKMKFFRFKLPFYIFASWAKAAIAGFFIGLAIITRTSEIIWLGPLLFILWFFNIKRVGITRLVIFISFSFLAIIPMLYWNLHLYGSILSGGYVEINTSIRELKEIGSGIAGPSSISVIEVVKTKINQAKDLIFYFGFHPGSSFTMFYNYFARMFAWLFWPAIMGAILYIQNIEKWKKKHALYFFGYALISVILILYYGSWEFHDNPDPNSITIGNSYTRYWLPIYMGAIPLAALFFSRFFKAIWTLNIKGRSDNKDYQLKNPSGKLRVSLYFFKNKHLKFKSKKILINGSLVVLVFAIAVVSVNFLLLGSEEGLLVSYYNRQSVKNEYKKVLNATEGGSIIVTQYHDKLFFPERKVIMGRFDDDNMNDVYGRLAKFVPIYYYNFTLREVDLDYLNDRRLFKSNIQIHLIKTINNTFSLYKLTPVQTLVTDNKSTKR